MAFITTESKFILVSGPAEGLGLLVGTYTNTQGSTGGVIVPGTPTTGAAAEGSVGLRKIIGNGWYAGGVTGVDDISAVVSYDTTFDRDIITLGTAADADGTYYILGTTVGQ